MRQIWLNLGSNTTPLGWRLAWKHEEVQLLCDACQLWHCKYFVFYLLNLNHHDNTTPFFDFYLLYTQEKSHMRMKMYLHIQTTKTMKPHELWKLFGILLTAAAFIDGSAFTLWKYSSGIVSLPHMGWCTKYCQIKYNKKLIPEIHNDGDLEYMVNYYIFSKAVEDFNINWEINFADLVCRIFDGKIRDWRHPSKKTGVLSHISFIEIKLEHLGKYFKNMACSKACIRSCL